SVDAGQSVATPSQAPSSNRRSARVRSPIGEYDGGRPAPRAARAPHDDARQESAVSPTRRRPSRPRPSRTSRSAPATSWQPTGERDLEHAPGARADEQLSAGLGAQPAERRGP